MSRKNSLTFRRGSTTVIVDGCYALTCFAVVAVAYIVFSPFRLAQSIAQSFSGGLLTHDDD